MEQLGSELVAVVDVAKTALDHECEGEVGIVGLIAVAVAWLGEHHYDLDIPEFRGSTKEAAWDMLFLRVPYCRPAGAEFPPGAVGLDEHTEELSTAAHDALVFG